MFQHLKRDAGQGAPTREAWNKLMDQLESLVISPGPGLLMRRASSGTVLSAQRKRAGLGGGEAFDFRVSVTKEEDTYYATVEPGYLRVKNPMVIDGENPVMDWMPTISGIPLNENTVDGIPPRLEVESDNIIYCHFLTDRHGIIVDPPDIVADSPQASIHYQPDPDGVDGEYWLPIARINITEDGVVTIFQHQHGGPIEFVPNLWTYENIGGGKKVVKGHYPEEDIYKFRTIKERASDPQVKVTEEDEYIEIKGNGYDNAITDARKVTMVVKDGLVVGLDYNDDEGGGINGTISIKDCDNALELLSLTFSEGRVTAVSSYGAAIEEFPLTVMVQSCHWIDDPPEDDWRS